MSDKFNKNKEALKGLIKEVNQEMPNEKLAAIEEKMAIQEETNAKMLETNTELKSKLESMQGKLVTLKQNTGTNTYLFKGYNPEISKNFRSTLRYDESEQVAKVMVKQALAKQTGDIFTEQAVEKVFSGSNAIPVQYGNAVMGLAELSSVALTYANVIVADAPTIKLPTKGTRDAVDSQSSGTANTAASTTIGQLTWTIDKRVGNYIEIYNSQLEDANFDIVNQIIVPFQAEAIGQNTDDEMFNGTEFTSSVSDVTASIDSTASITYTFANLNTMFYALTWERGNLNPKWFGNRAALKAISALVDSNSRPIFQQAPINGRPSQMLMGAEFIITPTIAATPGDGKIGLAFGDPKHYTIFIRGGEFVSMVNPYIKMKEDITQFICKARMDGNVSDHATATSSGAWTTAIRND
jgi:HK97 family phage major capsid protein